MRRPISPDGRPRISPAIMRTIVIAALTAAVFVPTASVDASSTGFDPRVIVLGDERDQIKNTPIEARPYRPLHVYGNTVRRRHGKGLITTPRSGSLR
jgi:hypothetical protein